MKPALRIAAQLVLYVPLMALIGYFSTQPRYSAIGEDQALLRMSFIHAAERKQACRQRSGAGEARAQPARGAGLPARARFDPGGA